MSLHNARRKDVRHLNTSSPPGAREASAPRQSRSQDDTVYARAGCSIWPAGVGNGRNKSAEELVVGA